MPMRGFTLPGLRVVVGTIHQHGVEAGRAGGVQFFHHIGEEQEFGRRAADGLDARPACP